jgi:AcrR family transcriptional regulator
MTHARPKTAAELLGVDAATTPAQGRDRLLLTAIELFYTHGFNAVGVDQVIAAAGVTKTTFYKHFESKDELVVEAVRRRDEWETTAWDRAVRSRAGDDPRARLLGLFVVMDEWFNAPDFRGCLFLNTAAEFPNPHDPIHQAAAAHKRKLRDGWRDLARQAGAADDAAAETFADLYATIVEGTLVMRQVHGRDDAARVSRKMAEVLVGQYLPPLTAGHGATA